MESEDYVNIPMPNVIVDKIKEQIKNTEFNSVAEYIIFVLREVLEDEAANAALTKEEENQVKATLRKLGYLKDE